jgi:hypothetical protein
LWGGVGSGKSATAIAYYIKNEAPKDIYVITTAKKRDSLDWQGEAAAFGISTNPTHSIFGRITVDSWNNIGNYTSVEDAFFIFDEQRVVGTGAWVKAFQRIARQNRWVLLSATPGDTWMDYVPVFIANGLYKNATEFKREHVVYAPFSKFPRIVRYLSTDTLEKYRNIILVEMPYKRHTNRWLEEVNVAYDPDMFTLVNKKRWHVYEDRPLVDVAEMFRVLRKIAYTDPSRLEAVKHVLGKHDRVIIFYNFNYELDILRTLVKDGYNVAEWNGHRKQPIPDTESWVYLVQYVAGAEGWNCITTNAMIFYSLTYSYKNFEQAQGRIDRMNTPYTDLYYYILLSKMVVDVAVKQSLDKKEEFNEAKYLRENAQIAA